MFELFENKFLTFGRCRYRNENGDVAFLKRTDKGFVGTIKFKDKRCAHTPLYVDIPVPEGFKGVHVDIQYPKASDISSDFINDTAQQFGIIVNRWISLIYDIKLFERNKDASPIQKKCFVNSLGQYEELQDLINTLI